MFWKIQFNDVLDGVGYLEFDENMVEKTLYNEEGNIITTPCGYAPIEFDVTPNF